MQSYSTSFIDAENSRRLCFQRFLIPPFDRLKFTILFVLANGLGWLLVILVLRPLQNSALSASWQEGEILGTVVSGFVSGLVIGAMQWLAIRRYVPSWLWIIASSAGYVILMTVLQGWRLFLRELFQNGTISGLLRGLPPTSLLVLVGVTGVIFTALCTIWLGLAQWLVLRRYAGPSWGWVFVPSIAVLLSSSLFSIKTFLLALKVFLPLDAGVLGAGVLGITQAIALSALQRREKAPNTQNNFLATAPEILSFRQVRILATRLRKQLKQAWRKEVLSDRPLTYTVGVDKEGTILAYEPANQPTTDFKGQTPLSQLIRSPETPSADVNSQPLTRFQVTFMPSGKLKLLSWRGVPLAWIAIGMLTAIILASAIVPSLIGKLPTQTD